MYGERRNGKFIMTDRPLFPMARERMKIWIRNELSEGLNTGITMGMDSYWKEVAAAAVEGGGEMMKKTKKEGNKEAEMDDQTTRQVGDTQCVTCEDSGETEEGWVKRIHYHPDRRAEVAFGMRVGEIRGIEMGAMWERKYQLPCGKARGVRVGT